MEPLLHPPHEAQVPGNRNVQGSIEKWEISFISGLRKDT